jgi:Gamma-glutamyl cyclotransferase, AIG2-like
MPHRISKAKSIWRLSAVLTLRLETKYTKLLFRDARSEDSVTAAPTRVWVFFYGTIMSPVVMKDFGVIPTDVLPAKVYGFDITIRPRPTLVRSDRGSVFGSIISVTHQDLTTIYSGLEKQFEVIYRPEAVLAVTRDEAIRPVLCYIAENTTTAPPDPQFLQLLAECVRTMGHPEWYAAHIEAQE